MPIASEDIVFVKSLHLSSLGGSPGDPAEGSPDRIGEGLGNLFDNVPASSVDQTVYRCFFVFNNTTTGITLQNMRLFFDDLSGSGDPEDSTPSTDTTIALAVDPAGINGVTQVINSEFEDPTTTPGREGMVFNTVFNYDDAGVGSQVTLQPGEFKGYWVKRFVAGNATPAALDRAVIRARGQTTS
jgi:hypothetical protein